LAGFGRGESGERSDSRGKIKTAGRRGEKEKEEAEEKFTPSNDPYVLAKFWRVVNGEVVPVKSGEVVNVLFDLVKELPGG
jgi:hypothetical protein